MSLSYAATLMALQFVRNGQMTLVMVDKILMRTLDKMYSKLPTVQVVNDRQEVQLTSGQQGQTINKIGFHCDS